MLERVWQYIKQLFGKSKTVTSTKQQKTNQEYNDDYTDIKQINFTSIFANKLATLATSDSTASIEENNARCELLNGAIGDVWIKIKKITSSALGTGGCALIPYVKDGKIYYNTVKQNRLLINSRDGERITGMTVLADTLTVNDRVYYRFVDYTINGNTLYITNRTSTEYGSPATVEEWKDIPDMTISNVDRVLLGFIKSPVDNRKDSDEYGVPITYGCGPIIEEIMECLKQIRKEFKLKNVRLQVDERTLKKDPKTGEPILEDELFMKGHSNDEGDLFNIFNPDIRESSYYARLKELFELLERQVGTSKGILTAPESYGATATEIKAAISDTFAIITDIRKAVEKGLEDYIYACDVLANYYNLTPQGEYEVKFDWSYQMLESSSETWQQMKDLQSVGALSKAELRSWVTGESVDEAQKAVDKITEKEPNLSTMLGMSE